MPLNIFNVRTIRGQLTAGLVLLESGFLIIFAVLLIHDLQGGLRARAIHRLQNQGKTLSVEATEAIESGHQEWLPRELNAGVGSRAIQALRITDADGKVIAEAKKSGQPIMWHLDRVQLSAVGDQVMVLPFSVTGDLGEGIVRLTSSSGRVLGYAWIMEDPTSDRDSIDELLRAALIIGVLNLVGCILLSALLARSITGPLAVLTKATRRLIHDPESQEGFPLYITERNEAADVARAFNLLVSSIAEKRAGLNDTLSLLDAMLANAPVGFAFFDRDRRCVRVNRYLAENSGISVHDYLGKSVHALMSPYAAGRLAGYIDTIFATGQSLHDQDFRDREARTEMELPDESRSWFLNVYPVRSGSDAVRWAGAVFVDVSERKRTEDALRKAEKLAAAGRLAASIAHEINNPLESVTNLLYLLEKHPSLNDEARNYAYVAQQEVARVSEMAQRTLRFYRQSTLPVEANVAEILDSVLMVYQGRFTALGVQVVTRFHRDAALFCFAGELRQVFANLIGNALDASSEGGHLTLCVRRSHCRRSGRPGVRITVADTGSGMPDSVRGRIFEPFFTTKDATGTGLGLWITTEILEKHGATIFVRTRQSDGSPPECRKKSGTVFMLFFPEHGVARKTTQPIADAVSV